MRDRAQPVTEESAEQLEAEQQTEDHRAELEQPLHARVVTTPGMALPTTMKAAVVRSFGGPSKIEVREFPMPEVGPNDVLIKVKSAGVGVWDAIAREGKWNMPGRPKLPRLLGIDGSGTVAAVGSRVKRFRVGEKVYACDMMASGFYATYAKVSQHTVGHAPPSIPLHKLGAFGCTGLTALKGLQLLKLKKGEPVLIFGASGAVGTIALQLANARGAHVIATASGTRAERMVKSHGAHVVIDARADDAVEQLIDAAPKGVGAVFACAGGDDLMSLLQVVKKGARVVFPHGVMGVKKNARYSVTGFDFIASRAQFETLHRWLGAHQVKVPIETSFPLEDAKKAHQLMETGHVVGRIVISM